MLSIRPIPRALVPVDSDAAQALSDRNYDEFQGDQEIWQRLQKAPACTMFNCSFPDFAKILISFVSQRFEGFLLIVPNCS